MVATGHLISSLLASGFRKASQITLLNGVSGGLDTAPQTGNIPYILPTERTFLLNVPETYRHEEPHPLVLSFHGGEGHDQTPSLTGSQTNIISSWRLERKTAAYH